jgi:pimeloyl-ACP methyl ester carboxylesterase
VTEAKLCCNKLVCWLAVPVILIGAGVFGFWLRPVSYFNASLYLHEYFGCVENRSIQVDGDRIHYLAEGTANGPVVVLVHGLGGRAEDWRSLTPYLVKAGFRVYMPDLPGYGRSEQPADFSYSVHDQAAVVVHFLDALGVKQADIGGWSMGGGIAQHVALRHPDRVRRLMLFDSIGIYEMPKWNVRLFTPTNARELEQLEALLEPRPQPIPGFVARDIVRVSDVNAWVLHRAVDSMLTGQDATDPLLPQLKMPVLLVWGERDAITPLSQGETMHRLIPQSQLDVAPGCGHLAPGECTDRIGPEVVTFLKQ